MLDELAPNWREVRRVANRVGDRWAGDDVVAVYGIPRGGVPVALMVAERLGVEVADEPFGDGVLVVDDLVDSGRTADVYEAAWGFDALYRKPHSPAHHAPLAIEVDGWLVFPWEANESPAEDAVVRLLEVIGDDPTRDGLRDTPGRVVRALAEMTAGLREDPADVLAKTFDGDGYDQMVVLRGIEFTSLCEHHLLPFTGTADVGYIANGPVVGISKLARLVEVFARRPQLQERMTQQIAGALEEHLSPKGVGVIVRAHHSCMGCRGVRKPSAVMVTSALLGAMLDQDRARVEFLGLVGSTLPGT